MPLSSVKVRVFDSDGKTEQQIDAASITGITGQANDGTEIRVGASVYKSTLLPSEVLALIAAVPAAPQP